jgi:hypothetical protein
MFFNSGFAMASPRIVQLPGWIRSEFRDVEKGLLWLFGWNYVRVVFAYELIILSDEMNGLIFKLVHQLAVNYVDSPKAA